MFRSQVVVQAGEEQPPAVTTEPINGEEEQNEGEIDPLATPVDMVNQRLQARREVGQAAEAELRVSTYCLLWWLRGSAMSESNIPCAELMSVGTAALSMAAHIAAALHQYLLVHDLLLVPLF